MKDEVKKSKQREKKEAIVSEVAQKAKKAKAVVFTNYQGMTHKQIEELKKGLKTADADLVVTKNTLLKIALQDSSFKDALSDKDIEEPTATIFAYADIIAPLKALQKSLKTLKLPSIKFGIFSRGAGSGSAREDWDLLAAADIERLFSLPPREVLIAQVVGGMKSPLYGLHRALNWNLQRFVMTLKAIETNKTS